MRPQIDEDTPSEINVLAQHLRRVQNPVRMRCLGNAPASLQDLDIEETKKRNAATVLGASFRSRNMAA